MENPNCSFKSVKFNAAIWVGSESDPPRGIPSRLTPFIVSSSWAIRSLYLLTRSLYFLYLIKYDLAFIFQSVSHAWGLVYLESVHFQCVRFLEERAPVTIEVIQTIAFVFFPCDTVFLFRDGSKSKTIFFNHHLPFPRPSRSNLCKGLYIHQVLL